MWGTRGGIKRAFAEARGSCGQTSQRVIVFGMSAAEIIEQIKQLPAEEKRAVYQFVNADSSAASQCAGGEGQALPMPRNLLDLFRKLAQ